jgi:hypothetical protein
MYTHFAEDDAAPAVALLGVSVRRIAFLTAVA